MPIGCEQKCALFSMQAFAILAMLQSIAPLSLSGIMLGQAVASLPKATGVVGLVGSGSVLIMMGIIAFSPCGWLDNCTLSRFPAPSAAKRLSRLSLISAVFIAIQIGFYSGLVSQTSSSGNGSTTTTYNCMQCDVCSSQGYKIQNNMCYSGSSIQPNCRCYDTAAGFDSCKCFIDPKPTTGVCASINTGSSSYSCVNYVGDTSSSNYSLGALPALVVQMLWALIISCLACLFRGWAINAARSVSQPPQVQPQVPALQLVPAAIPMAIPIAGPGGPGGPDGGAGGGGAGPSTSSNVTMIPAYGGPMTQQGYYGGAYPVQYVGGPMYGPMPVQPGYPVQHGAAGGPVPMPTHMSGTMPVHYGAYAPPVSQAIPAAYSPGPTADGAPQAPMPHLPTPIPVGTISPVPTAPQKLKAEAEAELEADPPAY